MKITQATHPTEISSNLKKNRTNKVFISFYLTSSANNSSLGNPIGWLQELCMARRWPPPTYETELEVGLPHERQFTIACVVLKYREIGQGKSKKIAKRLAANKMWIKLQESPLEQSQINQVLDEDGNVEVRERWKF